MIKQLLQKIFGLQSAATNRNFVLEKIDAAGIDELPVGKALCVASGQRLINWYNDALPQYRNAGEQWWLVTAAEFPCDIEIAIEDRSLNAVVDVRVETDSDILHLLSGRESMTREDVNCLVTSQLSGLLDNDDQVSADSLINTDAVALEQLRARLSLLLQAHGMRCISVGNFSEIEQVEPEEHVESANAEETESATVEEIAEVVKAVTSAEEWEELEAAVDEVTNINEQSAVELNELGKAVLDNKVDVRDAAERLQKLTRAAGKRAGVVSADLRRFRGLDLRLQNAEQKDENKNEPLRDSPGNSLVLNVRRRPRTWWMFSRHSVDERLRSYLGETIWQIRWTFDTLRSNTREASRLVKLRKIDERLQLVRDMLETNPTLTPHAGTTVSRTRTKELVRSVERAVTVAESAVGAIRQLEKADSDSGEWSSGLDTVCEHLDRLVRELDQRRALHL